MKYRRVNNKVIALIIEIIILVICGVVTLILDRVNKQINVFIWIAIYSVLLFAIVLTLSMIKYDRLREIRDSFKDTNLPLYTDKTTLMGHDIKDEEEKRD